MAFYKPEEVADLLGVTPEIVRAWVRRGKLRASRLAGNKILRISHEDLMDFYEQNATRPRAREEDSQ